MSVHYGVRTNWSLVLVLSSRFPFSVSSQTLHGVSSVEESFHRVKDFKIEGKNFIAASPEPDD